MEIKYGHIVNAPRGTKGTTSAIYWEFAIFLQSQYSDLVLVYIPEEVESFVF